MLSVTLAREEIPNRATAALTDAVCDTHSSWPADSACVEASVRWVGYLSPAAWLQQGCWAQQQLHGRTEYGPRLRGQRPCAVPGETPRPGRCLATVTTGCEKPSHQATRSAPASSPADERSAASPVPATAVPARLHRRQRDAAGSSSKQDQPPPDPVRASKPGSDIHRDPCHAPRSSRRAPSSNPGHGND